jgi:hypothetical protein
MGEGHGRAVERFYDDNADLPSTQPLHVDEGEYQYPLWLSYQELLCVLSMMACTMIMFWWLSLHA